MKSFPLFLAIAATLAQSTANARAFECLIEPRQTIELKAPTEGRIDRVHVDRGDTVRRGQVLVELDTRVEHARLGLAKFKAAMRGAVHAAESRLTIAEKKLQRERDLHTKNFVSTHERDEAAASRDLASAELAEARDNTQLAELEYREYEELMRQKTLTSPFDGVVMERQRHPGEVAQVDDRLPILKLAEIDPLYVEVILPVTVMGKVQKGDEVVVTPEQTELPPLRATVDVVDPVVDAASGTFGIRLKLPNPDHHIPAGIRCQAELAAIPADERPNRLGRTPLSAAPSTPAASSAAAPIQANPPELAASPATIRTTGRNSETRPTRETEERPTRNP